ncbi:hypothetical protein [Alkaliphilus sp. B6464]|uniref:hypothetical protein n=1 Tax=Alkaliphilus sp. B6464 TaxID=2731219 RepID=UPI001BA7353C|nr:hypothetical protein [Alkaliphilus sp. B6464]QUH18691.1 hypothetical protein HYG84_01390 [Alkaliphilus sp. B6464]
MKNYDLELKNLKRSTDEVRETMKLYSNTELDPANTKDLKEFLDVYMKGIVNELNKIENKNTLIVECTDLLQEIFKQLKESKTTGFDLSKLIPVTNKLYFKVQELIEFIGKVLPRFEHSLRLLADALEQIEEARMQISDIEEFEGFNENCTLGDLKEFVQKYFK